VFFKLYLVKGLTILIKERHHNRQYFTIYWCGINYKDYVKASPSQLGNEKCSLPSNLAGGNDVTVAEEHAAVVHGHAGSAKFWQEVNGTHGRRFFASVGLHLVAEQQLVVVRAEIYFQTNDKC